MRLLFRFLATIHPSLLDLFLSSDLMGECRRNIKDCFTCSRVLSPKTQKIQFSFLSRFLLLSETSTKGSLEESKSSNRKDQTPRKMKLVGVVLLVAAVSLCVAVAASDRTHAHIKPALSATFDCPGANPGYGLNCTPQGLQCCGDGTMDPACYDPKKAQCCEHYMSAAVVPLTDTCCGSGGPGASSVAFGCNAQSACCGGQTDGMGMCCHKQDHCCSENGWDVTSPAVLRQAPAVACPAAQQTRRAAEGRCAATARRSSVWTISASGSRPRSLRGRPAVGTGSLAPSAGTHTRASTPCRLRRAHFPR